MATKKIAQTVITEDKFYTIAAANGKVVEVKDYNTENGAQIQLWDNANAEWQQWSFVRAGEGVYRINDMGEYIAEEDWENVWADRPSWWPKAWMLADNGQFTSDEVSHMSVEGIEAAYADPAFEPEYAFYTEADEEGLP